MRGDARIPRRSSTTRSSSLSGQRLSRRQSSSNMKRAIGERRNSSSSNRRFKKQRQRRKNSVSVPIISLVTAVVVLLSSLGIFWVTKHSRLTPKSTVNSFFFAMRHSDMKGMKRCLDPTIAGVIDMVFGGEALTGVQDSEILSDIIRYDIYPTLNPQIKACQKRGLKADVTVLLDTPDFEGDVSIQETEYIFHLRKVHMRWYILYISKA